MELVQSQALIAREEMMSLALEAAAALGEAPAMVSPAEGNLRVFAHDVLHAHHDKDVRSLATFPISILENLTVDVWLMDYWGQMKTVRLSKDQASTDQKQVYILLHRMHARAVAPRATEPINSEHVATQRITNFAIEGWERWLEEELEGEESVIPTIKATECRRCTKAKDLEQGDHRAGDTHDYRKDEPKPIGPPDWADVCLPCHNGLQWQPAFAWGLHLREMFCGWHGLTDEAAKKSWRTSEPVDKWSDPDHETGYQEHHDCSLPEVRRAFDEEIDSLPGPDTPNLYTFANSCRTFCAWQKLNKGTRTWECPDGDGSNANEVNANEMNDWTADCIVRIDKAGKLFLFENQAADGIYPKAWNRTSMKQAIALTGVQIIPSVMCAWGLCPPDQPKKRHRKRFWLLVS